MPIDFSFTLLLYRMVSTFEMFFVLHHVGIVATSGRKLPKTKECNLSIGINMLVRCVVGFKLDIAQLVILLVSTHEMVILLVSIPEI